jgi:hypothetical protein
MVPAFGRIFDTGGYTEYCVYILKNPGRGEHGFLIGKLGERCPFLDIDCYRLAG